MSEVKEELYRRKVWVIMDKQRRVIAKGTPRNRCLYSLTDESDNKRILTYKSKGMARAGYTTSWFYNRSRIELEPEDMEPVEVEMIMRIVK